MVIVDNKGQVTIEVLVFSSIFLLAFMVVLIGISLYGSQDTNITFSMLSNELSIQLASAFTTVYSVGEGFNYDFTLPPNLGTKDYHLYIRTMGNKNSTVFVTLKNLDVTSSVHLPFYINCTSYIVNEEGIAPNTCELPPGKTYTIRGEADGVVRVV